MQRPGPPCYRDRAGCGLHRPLCDFATGLSQAMGTGPCIALSPHARRAGSGRDAVRLIRAESGRPSLRRRPPAGIALTGTIGLGSRRSRRSSPRPGKLGQRGRAPAGAERGAGQRGQPASLGRCQRPRGAEGVEDGGELQLPHPAGAVIHRPGCGMRRLHPVQLVAVHVSQPSGNQRLAG